MFYGDNKIAMTMLPIIENFSIKVQLLIAPTRLCHQLASDFSKFNTMKFVFISRKNLVYFKDEVLRTEISEHRDELIFVEN